MTLRHFYNKTKAFYEVPYEKIDISEIVRKENISDDDYMMIFRQTGVSPYAIREIIQEQNFPLLERLNDLYFEKPKIESNYIAYPITAEEINKTRKTPLVNLKDGDILVSFNTHTFDWRHGHCGIVIDAKNDILLEHMSLGSTSCLTKISDWGRYPGFLVLRYDDESIASRASLYAKENLLNVNYNIFAGLIKKDKSDEIPIDGSHCSHIVWQAYKTLGIDLDSNNGMIVTPKDISMSDSLKVVQIYGIDPEKYFKRLKKF